MTRKLKTRDELADIARSAGFRVTAKLLALLEETQQNGFQAGATMKAAVMAAPVRKPIASRRRPPIKRSDPREGLDGLLDKLRVPPKPK